MPERSDCWLLGVVCVGAILGAMAPDRAHAACVLTGTTVTCTDQDDNGIIAGNGVSVTVAAGAFVQSFYDGFDPDVCAGFRSAITVGRGGAITNRGTLLGRGNCSLGIEAGDTLTLTNEGDIRTGDNLSFAILTGNAFDVTNRARITTLNFGSTAFIGGNNGRFINAAGAVIETGGADSAGLFAENGNTITNDGRIATGNLGSVGIDVGATNTIVTTGTIATTGVASPGIRLRGSGNTVTNRGAISAIPAAVPRAGEDSIGIVAESGGNTIANAGTIAGDYAGVLLAGANNQLTNSGTITARAPVAATVPGAAVVVSGGAATIVNTGTIRGSGSAAIRATGGGTFALTNSGRIEGALSVNAGSLLTGAGTIVGNVRNDGVFAPGTGIGTMTIGGGYTQGATGRLDVEIDGGGASDRVTVASDGTTIGGALSLAGTVNVILTGAPVRNGQEFSIVTTNAIFLTISTLTARVTDPSPVFVDATLSARRSSLTLVVSRVPYASVAQGAAELSVAQALDRALPTATAAAGAIYSTLDQSDATNARALFGQLATAAPAAMQTWGILVGTSLANAVSPWLELAPSDSRQGEWRTWGGGFLRDGQSGSKTDASHSDYDMNGVVAAVDYAVIDGTRLGIAAARTEGETFFAAGGAQASLHNDTFAAYWSQAWLKLRAGAGVAFGEGNVDAVRTQTLAGAASSIASRTELKTRTAFVQTSYVLGTETWMIKPTALLTHVRSTVDAYAETAAIGLAVDRQRATSLRGDIGVRALAKPGPVHVTLGAFWSQNFKDNDRNARARLNNLPGSDFTIFGRAEKRGLLNAQLGANIEIAPGMMARVGWSGILNDRLGGHTASAGISYRW
ncbi:MAG: autotransporter domain-containing protein [Rhodospirillaceae bacterium]|nr:autotransporter domain-containing protein [Rhodospirillaceae bacterium]